MLTCRGPLGPYLAELAAALHSRGCNRRAADRCLVARTRSLGGRHQRCDGRFVLERLHHLQASSSGGTYLPSAVVNLYRHGAVLELPLLATVQANCFRRARAVLVCVSGLDN
jgi:hypothetical protein